ncbi:hypothetical protein X777_07001 [Ooceraea biroi]|uniref:Uncharacterized protein n=1 Tax=Ooceraea biroi TaxID=2015173 RepID=A0A026WC26_OOCBI|nr:hypothetical protein X777_07001 [Ooceraea biroi]
MRRNTRFSYAALLTTLLFRKHSNHDTYRIFHTYFYYVTQSLYWNLSVILYHAMLSNNGYYPREVLQIKQKRKRKRKNIPSEIVEPV